MSDNVEIWSSVVSTLLACLYWINKHTSFPPARLWGLWSVCGVRQRRRLAPGISVPIPSPWTGSEPACLAPIPCASGSSPTGNTSAPDKQTKPNLYRFWVWNSPTETSVFIQGFSQYNATMCTWIILSPSLPFADSPDRELESPSLEFPDCCNKEKITSLFRSMYNTFTHISCFHALMLSI